MKITCIDVIASRLLLIFTEITGKSTTLIMGDAMALLAGHQTCDLQGVGSNTGWAPFRSGQGQATYTCVPLSPSSIIWYRPPGVISLAGKVTTGLVESNCQELGSVLSPSLIIEYALLYLLKQTVSPRFYNTGSVLIGCDAMRRYQ